MSLVKKSLFLFGVGFLGFAQANASPIMATILLNEDGSPRCKIVQEEHGDFVETSPQVEDVLDELNALRECDDGDDLYFIVTGDI